MAFTYNGTEVSPGDFTVDYLELVGDSGKVDITYLFVELNINESIFSGCITGSLVVYDSLNIISNLPLMEGDLIKGKFKISEKDPYAVIFDPVEEMEFIFEVVKISSQSKVRQDVQSWIIAFVSTSWTDNLSQRVCKSYHQMPYSDMVQDIYDTFLSSGGIRTEMEVKGLLATPTEGLFNVIIPNWKPYEAIQWLAKRSFVGGVANYVFFEHRDSFLYVSIDELLARGPVEKYFMSSADQWTEPGKDKPPDVEIMRKRYLSINNLTFYDYHDLSLAAMKGMLGHRLIKFDMFNKRVTDYHPHGTAGANYLLDKEYDYFSDFGALNHCEKTKEMVTALTNEKMGIEDANTCLSVESDYNFLWDDQPSYMPDKWKRQHPGQMAASQFIKLEATCPGNFSRKVGEMIEIEFFSPQWKLKNDTQEPTIDEKFNGNYLITALRRKFTGDKHTTVLELVKDNYFNLAHNPIWDEAIARTYDKIKDSGN